MKAVAMRLFGAALLLGVCVLPVNAAAADGVAADEVLTRATDGYAGHEPDDGSRDPAELSERRQVPGDARTQARRQPGTSQLHAGEAWIHSASVRLFDDRDGDGYYTYLRVRLDADSLYSRHYVYAVLLLSADGVYWEDLHITDDFLIRGTSPYDAYEIDVELLSGYPTGRYDLLIELYDADRGLLLDEYGPADSPAFSLLPLEDVRHDRVASRDGRHGYHGGGGAVGWSLPLLLAAAAFARRRRWHRRPVVARRSRPPA